MSAGPRFPLRLLGVGPQRTGSSWLDRHLRRHPALAFPEGVKETFFFDRHWDRGATDYEGHFRRAAPGRHWAEIGPTYFDVPEVPARVRDSAPEACVVVTLRDPVERAVSLYQHHFRKGRVPESFWAAEAREPRIVSAGEYARHLPRWLNALGEDRVIVVLLDDVEATPEAVLASVLGAAGLDSRGASAEPGRVNAGSRPRYPALAGAAARTATALRDRRLHGLVEAGKRLGLGRVYRGGGDPPAVSRETRERLADHYALDIAFVERLTGRTLPWGQPGA